MAIQIVDCQCPRPAKIVDESSLIRLYYTSRKPKLQGWSGDRAQEPVGRVSLLAADKGVHTFGPHDKLRHLLCRFDIDWLKKISGDTTLSTDFYNRFDLRSPVIENALRRLLQEFTQPNLGSDAMIRWLGSVVAIEAARHIKHEADRKQSYCGDLSTARVRHIREFVDGFTRGFPTVSDIAAECGMSASHLQRMFRSTTGQTLHEFVEKERIARAQTLLQSTGLPVKEIAYRLGFSHQSTFSASFKQAVGEAPRDYRRRLNS